MVCVQSCVVRCVFGLVCLGLCVWALIVRFECLLLPLLLVPRHTPDTRASDLSRVIEFGMYQPTIASGTRLWEPTSDTKTRLSSSHKISWTVGHVECPHLRHCTFLMDHVVYTSPHNHCTYPYCLLSANLTQPLINKTTLDRQSCRSKSEYEL